MREHTPQNQGDGPGGGRRDSVGTSRFRASVGSGIARPQTSLRESRIGVFRASTQPSYNIFTGESTTASGRPPSRPPSRGGGGDYPTSQRAISRESSKENMAPPDAEQYETQRRRIEELKAEVGMLNYRITTHEQEKEMARLQHDSEVRDARRRAEEDFKLKQAAEYERDGANRQVEALQEEQENLRAEKDKQTRELERRAREVEDEMRLLREQLEDLSATKNEEARLNERRTLELQNQLATTQRSVQELGEEGQERDAALQKAQAQLLNKDATIGKLEADVLRLKAHTGDAETMAVIRRELTDQVTHIRALEATNRDQLAELKHLRKTHQAVQVVEEEKRSLQRRLDAAQTLEDELREAHIQRQRLEDERRAWTAYLQSQSSSDDGQIEFDSPEALARALVQERLNSASLVERLGAMEPELAQRDAQAQQLVVERTGLVAEIEQLRSAAASRAAAAASEPSPATSSDGKARQRLERQRALAVKEVEYLRAQLKTFDAEDITFQPENFDEQKAQRIQELEDLVDRYKLEAQTLHQELSALEASPPSASASAPAPGPAPAPAVVAGTKRPHEDDDDAAAGAGAAATAAAESEQLGQLVRKNRKLQDELSAVQQSLRLAEKELDVLRTQLASARESAKTRVLALKSNPTSDHEAIKASTLAALKQENAELLAHLQSQPHSFPTIPLSVVTAAQRSIADAQADAASAHKTSKRLKEVWAAKSAEFKEAIFSTLGWTVTFIPNGKMRVESVYHPSRTDEHENSIVFDGERGTMKVGGGPRSAFAQRIDGLIGFWVREKGCIPGFLAALTLEFYEEHSRVGQGGGQGGGGGGGKG